VPTSTRDLGRTLGLSVLAVALLYAASELTRPDGTPIRPGRVLISLALLLLHAACYWYGSRARERFGVTRYVLAQGALVLLAGISGLIFPVVACVYLVLTIEVVSLASSRWGSAAITVGALLLFAVNCMITFDLYRGASVGLLLAIAGAITHALVGIRRPAPPEPAPARSNGQHVLTQREMQVLQVLANGARNSQVASDLQITERTVKAHLGSIYQKLGVDSRTGAVSTARRLGLID
jgi:DNA-binding CsgD family transcriptional regulator